MARKEALSTAPKKPASKPGTPTQRFVDIAEIRDDVVIMKEGTLRAVLLVSSINFALKSQDEQSAIVQAYMGFLNALDFPIQVVIQSRRMNIDAYLSRLRESERGQTNELLRRQISDYRAYVKELVDLGEIMQKRFYVVIPFDPAVEQEQQGFFQKLGNIVTPSVAIRLSETKFKKLREQLVLRVNQVVSGLQSMSLTAVMLDTQSLIELYYTVYNPELFESQRLADVGKTRLEE